MDSMRSTNRAPINSSVTGVQSFRPELEFDIIKIVMLRESYLKRITKTLKENGGKVDIALIGMVDTLRECSLETVDVIQTWERTQVDYPEVVKPFKWNKQNYLSKMSTDYQFLSDYPAVEKWLGFSAECNPFFIPPEVIDNGISMQPNSFVVFGVRPPAPPVAPRAKPILTKFVKSPYLTPIHNDLDVFPQNSAVNKAKSKEKLRGVAQAAADALQQVGKDKAKDALTDPFQNFVNAETIMHATKMLAVLVRNNDGQPLFTLSTLGGSTYNASASFVTADEYVPSSSAGSTMPPGPGSPMKGSTSAAGEGAGTLPPAPGKGQGFSGKALGSQLEEGSVDALPQPASGQMQAQGSPPRPLREGMVRAGDPTHNVHVAAASPDKLSINAAVGTTGAFAGRLGSTSVFSQNREDFESTQDGFRQTMQNTGDRSHLDNKAMRMDDVVDKSMAEESYGKFTSQLDSSFASQQTATTNSSKIWTPHEITLQRAVRRRGGELFVLTAAGTRGHIKAPTRRTRYERLNKEMLNLDKQAIDLEKTIEKTKLELEEAQRVFNELEKPSKKQTRKMTREQSFYDGLVESKRGIDSYRTTLNDQYANFKLVMNTEPSDLNKQRRMHAELNDGQALPDDEQLSMNLEDKMAFRVQRFLKKCLGKQLRKAEWARRNAAAVILQNLARRKQNEGAAYERGIRLSIAIRVQKLARGAGGKEAGKKMAVIQRRKHAGDLIKRVARGYIARNLTKRKKLFIKSVGQANFHASLNSITPEHLDDLADLIESYQRDYTVALPIQVMSVLRGLLYMQIGDDEEELTVDNGGYVEHVTLYADKVGWNGFRLLLRRKGRFMRKIRAMVNFISLPGPRALAFSDECIEHLEAVISKIKDQHFESIDSRNQATIIHFLEIIRNLKRAYDFQEEFPEYFIPTQPNWYRLVSRYQKNYQMKIAELSMYRYCKKQIDVMREEFKETGKAWKPVALAAETNKIELERTAELAEVALALYDKEVSLFEREEMMNISLINGFKVARQIGVAVCKRDWEAFMAAEGDEAPEWRIARQRLTVDKAELDLLASENKIFFAEKAKARDKRARDFKQILKLEEVRRICKAEGQLLGKLMVLQYVWERFVREIGGFQYIYDLTGEKKQYYLNTKLEVQTALVERRRLKKLRLKEIDYQFNHAADIAHNARIGEFTASWDVPTDMEIAAEKQEDEDCRKRDADLEGKAARAAKRMKIPPAPFKPLMLLIDIRVPKVIKKIMRERLVPLHFKEIVGRLDDPTLTLRVQKLMDTRWNIFIFADRGTNMQARTAFLGYFRALLYSLIPRPRVVALDAFLALRYDNWYLKTAAEYDEIYRNNVANSTEASLLLSRLRKTALVFKQCLIFETKQDEIEAGANAVLPSWLREVFRNDLDAFMNEIERPGDENGSLMSMDTSLENAPKILAASIAAIMGWWKAPLLEWREKQILVGVECFKEHVSDAPKLCDMLWFSKFPEAKVKNLRRIANSQRLTEVWAKIKACNFYTQPARYLLARWVLEGMDLIDGITRQGGGADENFNNCPIAYSKNLNWKDDIADPETIAEQTIGELLHECLSDNLIYEDETDVNEYRARDDVEDIEQQFFASETHKRIVRVYHSDTRAYVGIERPGMHGEKSTWQFFSQMDIIEIVSMLAPNATELYEGTVERLDISENGKDKWWELLAKWGRLEHIGKTCRMQLLRSRYLMLTKVGMVNGFLVRYELFEERYAEILILVHGLPGTGTVYFRVNKEVIAHLLASCDIFLEKMAIQMQEAMPIAYIFSDRLQTRPSKNQLWWMDNGELEPKQIWGKKKPLKVSLRIKGGPGRLAGRRMFTLNGILLLITIFEVSNPSDIASMRIVFYDCTHCQTAECRLSDMEKVGLFNDDSPILEQIFGRMRTVYTRVHEFGTIKADARPTILLDPQFEMTEEPVYFCEGDTEYFLLDDIQLQYSRDHADSDNEEHEMSSKSRSRTRSDVVDGVELSDDDSQLEELRKETEEVDAAKAADDACLIERDTAKPWHWCIYFSRTTIEENIGNLTVSAGLNVTKEGFDFYVLDNRTLREQYTFISFRKSLPFFYNVTMEAFRKRLKNINENVVFEFIDELFSVMEMEDALDSDGVGVETLSLRSDKDEIPPMVLGYFREVDDSESSHGSGRKTKAKKIELQRVEIQVLAARNLATLSGIAARNPIAIIKWNMREIGRTVSVKHTCNPDWDDPGIRTATTKDKTLEHCSLEVEVWDFNFQKARTTEFLGSIRLRGSDLIKLFENGSKMNLTYLPLGRSNRMNDHDNQFAGGDLILFGLHHVDWDKLKPPQTYRIVAEEDKKEYDKAIAEEKSDFDKQQLAEERAKNGIGGWIGWGAPKTTEVAESKEDIVATESVAITRKPKAEKPKAVLADRPSSRSSVALTKVKTDRSIRFSMRHKSPEQLAQMAALQATHFAKSDSNNLATPAISLLDANRRGNSRSRVHSAPRTGSAEGLAEQLRSRIQEKETLGDLEEESTSIKTLSFGALGENSLVAGSSMMSDSMGMMQSVDDEEIPETYRSKAQTDDTYENPGSEFDDYVPFVFTLKLLQLEGIPDHCENVVAVVKFNGFESGRTESLKCLPTVDIDENGELTLEIGDDKNRQEILRQQAWEEFKENDSHYMKIIDARKAKLAREEKARIEREAEEEASLSEDDDKESVASGSNQNDDESAYESLEQSAEKSLSLAEESFISEDRKFHAAVESDSVHTYVIPDRIRRSDTNSIAIFPRDSTFQMTVPSNLDINSCNLAIELWDIEETELLGEVDLRGTKLKTFVEESGLAKQWVEFRDPFHDEVCKFENMCGDMYPLRIMSTATDNRYVVDPDHVKPIPRYFTIVLKCVKFLPGDFIPMWKEPVDEVEEEPEEVIDESNLFSQSQTSISASGSKSGSGSPGKSQSMSASGMPSQAEIEAAVSKAKSKLSSIAVGEESDDDIASYNSEEEEWRFKVQQDTGVYVDVLLNDELYFTSEVMVRTDLANTHLEFPRDGAEIGFEFDPDTDIALSRLTFNIYSKDGMMLHERPAPRHNNGSMIEDIDGAIQEHDEDSDDYDDESGEKRRSAPKIEGQAQAKDDEKMNRNESDNVEAEKESKVEDSPGIRYLGTRTITGEVLEEFLFRSKEDVEPEIDDTSTVAASQAVAQAKSFVDDVTLEDGATLANPSVEADGSLVADSKDDGSVALQAKSVKSVAFDDDATPTASMVAARDAKEAEEKKALEGSEAESKDSKDAPSGLEEKSSLGFQEQDLPGEGLLTFQLNLAARLAANDPEPDEEDNEAWLAWESRKSLRESENKIPRTCELDILGWERIQIESDLDAPDDIDYVVGYTSRPGTALEPPKRITRNRNPKETNVPNLTMTGRIGTGERPGTNNSGVNMAIAPAMFSGGLTLDGFAFAGTDTFNRPGHVTIYRQNAMSETQDLPRRKLYLQIGSISAEGKKPTAGTFASMANWGWGASKPVEEDTRKTEGGEKETIELSLSKSRKATGVSILSRYVDCAKFMGPRTKTPQEGDDDEVEEKVEAEEVEIVAVSEKIRKERRGSTLLLSRHGSVSVAQRRTTFLNRKRAHDVSSFENENNDDNQMGNDNAASNDAKGDDSPLAKRQRTESNDITESKPGAAGDGNKGKGNDLRNEIAAAPIPDPVVKVDQYAFREVQVFFNGFFVHEMLIPIIYSDEPTEIDEDGVDILKNPELFKIPIFVPRGQLLEACRLEIVVYQLNELSKKDKVVGVRVFEGDDLAKMFSVPGTNLPASTLNPAASGTAPGTAPAIAADSASRPGTAVSFQGLPEDTLQEAPPIQDVNMESPRPTGALYYDMEIPGSYNPDSDEGIALAAEKAEISGAAEYDYNETSGLNLGVTVHDQERILQSREKGAGGTQGARRKVEVRLLAVTGLVKKTLSHDYNNVGAAKSNKRKLSTVADADTDVDTQAGPGSLPTMLAEGFNDDDSAERDDFINHEGSGSLNNVGFPGAEPQPEELGGMSVLTAESFEIEAADAPLASKESVQKQEKAMDKETSQGGDDDQEKEVESLAEPKSYSDSEQESSMKDSSMKSSGMPEKEKEELAEPKSDSESGDESEPVKPSDMMGDGGGSLYDGSSIGNDYEEQEDAVIAVRGDKEIYAVVRWNGQDLSQSHPMPVSNSVLFADGSRIHDGVLAPVPGAGSDDDKTVTSVSHSIQKQDVRHLNAFAPIVDPVASSSFTMYVPTGHSLQGCYLEIAIMQAGTCLGSTALHGDDLISFLEGYGAVQSDEDYYEDYDPEDDTATTHRSYALDYSPSVPRDVQPAELTGRLVLRGRVMRSDGGKERRPNTTTNPFDAQHDHQFHTTVNIKKKTHQISMFRIRSKLKFDEVGWRHFYDKTIAFIVNKKEKDEMKEKRRILALPAKEQIKYSQIQAGKMAKLKGRPTPVQSVNSSQVDDGSQITDLKSSSNAESDAKGSSANNSSGNNKSKDDDNISVVSGDDDEKSTALIVFPEQRTGKNLPRPFKLPMLQFKLEESAVKYVAVNESVQEDARICWRGRAMPKHFKGGLSKDLAKSMMKSRSSRLIKMKGIDDMKLLSDVHFLKDMGNAKQTSADALPICVKEIVSTGPGICKRLYRIEISTNAGQPIGSADIETDVQMIKCAGVKNVAIFGEDGRKGWDMAKIFGFIVNERCEIDFMPTERKKVLTKKAEKKAKASSEYLEKKVDKNRRDGISAGGGEKDGKSKPNSVVALMQDEILPLEVKFSALYGLNSFSRDMGAYDDDEMKQEARRMSTIADNGGDMSAMMDIAKANAAANRASDGAIAEEDSDYASSDDVSLSESSDDESSTEASAVVQEQYLRIYTKTHRMGGIQFKTIIMLMGRISNLFTDPNEYFDGLDVRESLCELQVIFRCKDAFTKITHELQFSGMEIFGWLSEMPNIASPDLRNKYRRAKFGELLLHNLVMRYSNKGDIILDLINEEIGQLTVQTKAMGDDLNTIQLAGSGNAEDGKSKRAQMRAEQAAEARRHRKERREEKRQKIRDLDAERERIKQEKKDELAAAQKAADRAAMTTAGQAGAAAADALSNAGAAAANALKSLKFW